MGFAATIFLEETGAVDLFLIGGAHLQIFFGSGKAYCAGLKKNAGEVSKNFKPKNKLFTDVLIGVIWYCIRGMLWATVLQWGL